MEQLDLDKLREARKSKGLSLKMAAKMIGKDAATICRYEIGQTAMTVNTLFWILQLYGISINDIVMVAGKASI